MGGSTRGSRMERSPSTASVGSRQHSRVAIQRQVEQTIKVEAKKRDRQFHKHHDALRAEETGYMQEIDAFLDYRKQSASEKKQEVFQRWDKEVFKKIQEEVNEKLGGVS